MSQNSRIIQARQRVKPLGIHTAAGHLQKMQRWKEISFLKENNGQVPPFIISVGSRTRVLEAPYLLGLKNWAFIDEEAKEKFGIGSFGRVSLCIGIAQAQERKFPLMVAESQMGCPAAQINVRELLYFADPGGYFLEGTRHKSDGLYVIRAGTCGGVNSKNPEEKKVAKIGDIAIAQESIGSVGTLIQSRFGALDFVQRDISREVSGTSHFSPDRKHLATKSSKLVVEALVAAARANKIDFLSGANFTKDSLYAEMGEDDFAALRDKYGVVSTEMEQMALDTLAHEFTSLGLPVHSGLVSAVIGAIPGKSFPETEEEHKRAKNAEENAVILAKDALGGLAARLL